MGSKSTSTSTQTSSWLDNRLVVDGGALGLSTSGSGNTINVLDSGITKSAIELSETAVVSNALTVGNALTGSLGFAGDMAARSIGALERQAVVNSQGLGNAYKDAAANSLSALDKVIAFAGNVFSAGSASIDRQASGLTEAYKEAKGSGFQENALVIAALAAVAVVAFSRK